MDTALLWFDKGSGPEASPSWFRGDTLLAGLRTRQAIDKIDWDANGDAVVVKFAFP